jgi:excinuclease ABC subunit B
MAFISPAVGEPFELESDFELRGDQPHAIAQLTEGLRRGDRSQVLLGVTGSGKTFTMAQVLATVNRPALVMVHNKALAAQLYQEFRRFFPKNAVEFFVSYYDYYQPEAFMPATDTYIEKEAIINEEIDRMRLSATRSLFERRDVIIVASVSCIYGLGSPEAYYGLLVPLERGQTVSRDEILRRLRRDSVRAQRPRVQRGSCRVRGDHRRGLSVYDGRRPAIGLFGDEIDELLSFDPADRRDVTRHTRSPSIRNRTTSRRGRDPPPPHSRPSRASRPSGGRLAELEHAGRVLEAQAAAPADDVRISR